MYLFDILIGTLTVEVIVLGALCVHGIIKAIKRGK
jgi:hypothetical protein